MTADDAKDFTDKLKDAGLTVKTGDEAAGHSIDGMIPEIVVYPADLRELSLVMEEASREDVVVAPWGGGTSTTLGNPLERLDAVVDMSRLDRIVEHNPADLTATVQAGITLDNLQRVLGEHGQFLALDPPLPDRATLGGTLATGVSGPLKWQYGSPRDVVIGMKVVQADGRVTKSGGQVVKNVSGYDMSRLHIGGLGTLGIIAEVSLKLTPLPVNQATVVASYDTVRQSGDAGLDIFHSHVMPLALTMFDAESNSRMRAVKLSGAGFLAVRLGGRPLTLERQVRECRSLCHLHGASKIEVMPDTDATSVWRRLADFGWDEETAPASGGRASVPPSRVLELLEALERPEDSSTPRPSIVSHPAHGTVLVSWYDSVGGLLGEVAADVLCETRDTVHRLGGRMVIERCPSDVKHRFDVLDDVGEPVSIIRRLKEQYDPKRILNPGRFVGGI